VLLVVAGPSGVGKGTIVRELLAARPDVWFSVSMTTRAPRPGEVHGRDYLFVDRAEFEARQAAGGFLESFDVYGDLKGTPRAPVEEHLARGEHVLLEIDVQGALAVREVFPDAVLVFVQAPDPDEQRRRLIARATDDPGQLAVRLATAAAELEMAHEFDHVVVNDDVGRAVRQLAGILDGHTAG